jgi:hypothetical protein
MGDSVTSELSKNNVTIIAAQEYIDAGGSVVRSGIMLADAVLQVVESGRIADIDFQGLKGASSSYFNVLLRRIEEGCGLPALDEQVRFTFSSKIQKMIYERSLESIKRSRATPALVEPREVTATGSAQRECERSLWRRLLSALFRSVS